MYYESLPKKDYGSPQKELVDKAYAFLFSHGKKPDYDEFFVSVQKEFNRLGCFVLWKGVKSPYSDLIGDKEVVIADNCVKASRDYRKTPRQILRVS